MQLILEGFAKEIWQSRYAYPGEKYWNDTVNRVSNFIASVELPDEVEKIQKSFYDVMNNGDFVPGGRILFGAGRRKFNMLNCYALTPEDTVDSIGKTIRDTYLISCGGGGVGFNFSSIRPKGDDIQNIKWSAPGAVSNMRMINEIGEHVRAGKNRRTALIAILNVDHPDLLEFLHIKLNLKELNNFNISIGISDDFIEAVRKNKKWSFKFNNREYQIFELDRKDNEGKIESIKVPALNKEDALGRAQNHYKTNFSDSFENPRIYPLKAREIWDILMVNAWKSGDPGIYNLSLANNYTNVSYFEELRQPNPCGEIPLPAYGNCCLGHVNLSNMYDESSNDVNWKKLAKTIRLGIRFLDNVLTANHYPIPECKTVGERSRRIGLGVTGLHYLLIKLGYFYGDEKCIEFLDRLFATFRNEAYKASIKLAQERGAFPLFDLEKFSSEEFFKQLPSTIQKDIRRYGIRNAVMLTIAPVGTTSIVLGVSSGVEPIFAPAYERSFRYANIWKNEIVIDPLFKEFYDNHKLLDYFQYAHDITVENHLKVQATIQKYIDSSLSKTTNLPEDYPVEQLSDVILEYASFIKGFTIYRTNSRGLEPLKPIRFKDTHELDQLIAKSITIQSLANDCSTGICEI